MRTLTPTSGSTIYVSSGFDRRIGSASSDVARYTATIVPIVRSRCVYNALAMTEKPHCGMAPPTAATRGPTCPAPSTASTIRCCHLASTYSSICLLYTSDAADDLLCVDLGGGRL